MTVRPLLALALTLPLCGCLVQTKTNSSGRKDVDVSTPLGGLSVKTSPNEVADKIGLPVYPGAVPEKKKDDNESSANVNMNFGFFHMSVNAASYTTTDSPEQVRDFYKKALGKYSDVIECHEKQPVGQPTKTGLGLTCADDDDKRDFHTSGNANVKVFGKDTTLKAGSKARQHLVTLDARDGGTRFGLVALELPSGNGDAN